MTQSNNKSSSWKTQLYLLGAAIGAFMGFLSAYLFAREAQEEAANDERPEISPSVMLGLALSAMTLMRQIAETGKKNKKKS